MIEWKPIATCPPDGKVLLAVYAPTNWAYYVVSVTLTSLMPMRHRELQMRYARAWAEYPPPPPEEINE